MKRTYVLVLAIAGVLLTGCGSTSEPAATDSATVSGEDRPGQEAGGCPLTAADLSEATSLTWELREKREDHPLETLESVKATVCLFTAADAPQEGADPLVLRADVVTGEDVATVKKEFDETCVEYGGELQDSGAGAVRCSRKATVVEGLVGGGDRLVNVYLVNADTATATKLTPAFGKVLAAVS